jgi:hypothetical protein
VSLPRVAAFFIICGIALSAIGKAATPESSITKPAAQTDDIPKSIAESVRGTLRFAEGEFLGLAEAMPEEKYSSTPTNRPVRGRPQLRRTSEARRLCPVRLLQGI